MSLSHTRSIYIYGERIALVTNTHTTHTFTHTHFHTHTNNLRFKKKKKKKKEKLQWIQRNAFNLTLCGRTEHTKTSIHQSVRTTTFDVDYFQIDWKKTEKQPSLRVSDTHHRATGNVPSLEDSDTLHTGTGAY